MKLREIFSYLEQFAPISYQEGYDNAGLICGNADWDVKGVLCSLDATEEIIDEAISKGLNVVIAHHPIVFKGLKKINGKNYVERAIIKAIKNDVAIYAIHTNLDNVYFQGVNAAIAEKIGLQETRILAPRKGLCKLNVRVPTSHSELLRNALSLVGAVPYNNQHNSYALLGIEYAQHENSPTVQLSVVFPEELSKRVVEAIHANHPWNPSYDITSLLNEDMMSGAGLVGMLESPMTVEAFLTHLKSTFKTGVIKHTKPLSTTVQRIALCGGAGSFLVGQAIGAKADVYISGDFKYHEFFDADGKIMIADIGHFESEQFTIDAIKSILIQKFSTFAVQSAEVNTNPVLYF